ncbi:hypothetical protein [Oleisolibacter albus]|uniref:hypothetical protein n=1 Tax=Oleisolibacter albus TaxID=2171757 RepID=UPI0012D82874|nr:hypothetical protein [Oleisolibacter albus]
MTDLTLTTSAAAATTAATSATSDLFEQVMDVVTAAELVPVLASAAVLLAILAEAF